MPNIPPPSVVPGSRPVLPAESSAGAGGIDLFEPVLMPGPSGGENRTSARPILPWLVFPLLAVAAWVPSTGGMGWWLAAAVVATVIAAMVFPRLPNAWHGPLLLPGVICLGLAWGAATYTELTGPAVATISGRVVSVSRSGFTQKVRLRQVVGSGVATAITLIAPPVPGLRPGDQVRAGGAWTRSEYGEQVRAQWCERAIPREKDLRGAAWAALERLGPQRELAATLLLGAGDPLERLDFRNAGLAHVLAVSGLHLGIAAALAWWLLRRTRLRWALRVLALATLVGGYAWLTGGSPATERAAMMVAVATLAALLGREPHRLGILATAAGALVLMDPFLVHDLGFQFSVLAVFGILTLGLQWTRWRQRMLPLQAWPLDGVLWRGILWLGRSVTDGLLIGTAASWALVPLMALTFQVANPWSSVATVLVAPLVAGILWLGLPWLLFSMAWPDGPWAGLTLALDGLLAALALVAEFAAGWQYARVEVPAGSGALVLVTPLLLVTWPIRGQAWLRWAGAMVCLWWWGPGSLQ